MILTNIGFVLGVVLAAVLLAVIVDAFRKANKNTMSFRESMDLVGLPIVTFSVDGKKFNFLLDTGANNSAVNRASLDVIKHKITDYQTNLYGLEGNKNTCRYVSIRLEYKNKVFKQFTEDFLVTDLSKAFNNLKSDFGVNLHGIIGSSFLEKYKYMIDFKEMIAYSRA